MLSYVEISGYKSISNKCRIEFPGLTVMAGTNSSGKSSFMQPLLLIKQTLECPYDPGVLLLDGPNTKLTATEQLISKIKVAGGVNTSFEVTFGTRGKEYSVRYRRTSKGTLKLDEATMARDDGRPRLRLKEGGKVQEDQLSALSEPNDPISPLTFLNMFKDKGESAFYGRRDRSFLNLELRSQLNDGGSSHVMTHTVFSDVSEDLKQMLHVPGLRGNPERTYSTTEVGNRYPGTYENYIASIIWKWKDAGSENLAKLGDQLRLLGLTWKISAKRVQDTRVELLVGRLPRPAAGGAKDLVSLADVGLGVAQVLPFLVALLSASRDQLVYIEQPELHLHPRAQWRLSEIIRDAVNRGVKVVVETHSSVLIKGLQTQVAAGNMSGDIVRLNWFTRNQTDGCTQVKSVRLDKDGAVGDWPGDFDSLGLEVEGAYLDAVLGVE